jgi:hypothetical protein
VIVREVTTIRFSDAGSGGEAIAIVRQCGDKLGLAISIRENGDLEVFLDRSSACELSKAIGAAINLISEDHAQ